MRKIERNGSFTLVTVARSSSRGPGQLEDASGKPFGADDIATYKSADAPFKLDPVFSQGQ